MLVWVYSKGIMFGRWLAWRRGGFQKQSPLSLNLRATFLEVSDLKEAEQTEKGTTKGGIKGSTF